ncbi:MAG TPA: DUF1493 family protein [Trichormus sp. M33_DOE_039]|nr:DUF1493 family protein [Trichormus sp. M33_DOE_039]
MSHQLGIPTDEISLNTRLREDLKIDGDEVEEIFYKISEYFDIDWQGFVFYRYFYEEPHLFSQIFNLYYRQHYGKLKTITVSHLVSVVECGFWFEPNHADNHI